MGSLSRFEQKWAFRGSEWDRWLGLVAFLFGNHIKFHGHRQTLGNRRHEHKLALKLWTALTDIEGLTVYGPDPALETRAALAAFNSDKL